MIQGIHSGSESREARALIVAWDRLESCTATVVIPRNLRKTPKKKNLKFYKTKPLRTMESINRPQKWAKTKPNEAKKAEAHIGISPFGISQAVLAVALFSGFRAKLVLQG
jgi:hypothetical protein